MHVVIDLEGAHDPPWAHVIVDRESTLVDLRGLGGPADDPLVTRIEVDEGNRHAGTGQIGEIVRKQLGVDAVGRTPIFSADVVKPYLEAFRRKMDEHAAAAEQVLAA